MNSIKQIQLDANQALKGAYHVRTSLLNLLTTGPDNVGDLAYAVKSRVKAEESLINKILHKRKDRPTYSAQNVTDIVGLRLLGLTSEHLPTICERFISFIHFCQQPELALFVGDTLDEAIHEVKIYKSQANPVIYEKIYLYLRTLNFTSNKVELKAATDADPYSSVHLVCKTYSFQGGHPKPIPLEVQIRTVFEDAWAEIDHPLRYKGATYLGNAKSRRYLELKSIADQCSDELKTSVDACLKNADTITKLHGQLSDSFRRQVSSIKFTPIGARLTYRSLYRGNLPNRLKRLDKEISNISTVTKKAT